ncbi:hypothetical protein [Streptomyces sp. NPDC004134]|uniref:hypothetical protein n=1 Tax=Streptomyces sp. NPDC004134 TaxID=3364691 RepID=UPI0036C9B740
MTRRAPLTALVLCPLLVLTACGEDDAGGGPSPAADGAPDPGVPAPPAASRAPAPGDGSQDPDDINGDGHRDLLVPVFPDGDPQTAEERVAVVYGSADGLDPATRTVYGRRDLGLPALPAEFPAPDLLRAADVTTADLDGDGFPDFVTTSAGTAGRREDLGEEPQMPYVTFGGPEQPAARPEAVPLRLPGVAGVEPGSPVRGDFDADGHHDLAMPERSAPGAKLVVLYGPFSRAGEPARTDTSLPVEEGTLSADGIDPTGEPRATALLRQGISDGGQDPNTLYPARPGTGLTGETRELTAGSGHAFGDFDGDGQRDVAVGDDGGRNNEPGYETEAPEVDGKATLYPGSGDGPVVLDLPEPPAGEDSSYGPGGFAAADPDGDGRDGLLVATYDGAVLLDGDERTPVLREGPARTADGKRTKAKDRNARPVGAADFDADGKDELILDWAPDPLFALYGEKPAYWWITEGATDRDAVTFATTEFTPRRS